MTMVCMKLGGTYSRRTHEGQPTGSRRLPGTHQCTRPQPLGGGAALGAKGHGFGDDCHLATVISSVQTGPPLCCSCYMKRSTSLLRRQKRQRSNKRQEVSDRQAKHGRQGQARPGARRGPGEGRLASAAGPAVAAVVAVAARAQWAGGSLTAAGWLPAHWAKIRTVLPSERGQQGVARTCARRRSVAAEAGAPPRLSGPRPPRRPRAGPLNPLPRAFRPAAPVGIPGASRIAH